MERVAAPGGPTAPPFDELFLQAAGWLGTCFDGTCAEIALVRPDGDGQQLLGDGFSPLPSPALGRWARDALAAGAAIASTSDGVTTAAAPLHLDGRPLGALVCRADGADPGLLRALAAAAARGLAEQAARSRLEVDQQDLLRGAEEARADAETAQRRLAFLDQASSALFGAKLEPEARLTTLARLVVPDLADWCWIDVFESGQGVARHAISHWNPEGESIARRERGRWLGATDADARLQVMGKETGLLIEDMRAHLQAGGVDAALFSELGARTALVVPLRTSAPLGEMTFVFAESSRRHVPADLVLASALAQRAALALENARLYQEADRAVRARDEMLAVVSHDLRNPLSAILANAGVLVRRLPPGEDFEPIHKRAEAIRRSAERMNHLIRDLLDMARIDSRLLQIERAPHELGGLLGEAMEMFQPLAADRDVSLGLEMDDGNALLLCDRERVLQVLSNLMGNAVKFTPGGGSVRLVARCCESEVRLGVSDTGPGIAPEFLEQIFDRFWQVRASGRAGAGLGLSIARGIVDAHGGRIWAESRPGQGSTFWFTLPRG